MPSAILGRRNISLVNILLIAALLFLTKPSETSFTDHVQRAAERQGGALVGWISRLSVAWADWVGTLHFIDLGLFRVAWQVSVLGHAHAVHLGILGTWLTMPIPTQITAESPYDRARIVPSADGCTCVNGLCVIENTCVCLPSWSGNHCNVPLTGFVPLSTHLRPVTATLPTTMATHLDTLLMKVGSLDVLIIITLACGVWEGRVLEALYVAVAHAELAPQVFGRMVYTLKDRNGSVQLFWAAYGVVFVCVWMELWVRRIRQRKERARERTRGLEAARAAGVAALGRHAPGAAAAIPGAFNGDATSGVGDVEGEEGVASEMFPLDDATAKEEDSTFPSLLDTFGACVFALRCFNLFQSSYERLITPLKNKRSTAKSAATSLVTPWVAVHAGSLPNIAWNLRTSSGLLVLELSEVLKKLVVAPLFTLAAIWINPWQVETRAWIGAVVAIVWALLVGYGPGAEQLWERMLVKGAAWVEWLDAGGTFLLAYG